MVVAAQFSSLIDKLGHPLVDVRVPALKSFVSKLKLEILTVEDLCQERLLFIKLLEWFNFDTSPNEELVFQIIKTLISNPNGAENFLRIGAVEFFSELRGNVLPDFIPEIDLILHRLLSVYDVTESDLNVHFLHKVMPDDGGQKFLPTVKNREPKLLSEDLRANDSRASYIQESTKRMTLPLADITNMNTTVATSVCSKDTKPVKSFLFAFYPWRPLTHSDKHVLDSAKFSLLVPETEVVVSSCQFINDVLLNDFPPEVFLQRPTIVECLFNLLKVRQRTGFEVHIEALEVMTQLCLRLKQQLRMSADPDFHTAGFSTSSHSSDQYRASSSVVEDLSRSLSKPRLEQNHNSSICSESTIDGPFRGGKEFVDSEVEDIISPSENSGQFSLPQFCTSAMLSIDHLYTCCNPVVAGKLVMLSHLLLDLVEDSVNLDEIWREKSTVTNLFCKDFQVACKSIVTAIKYHQAQVCSSPVSASQQFKLHCVISRAQQFLFLRCIRTILAKCDLSELCAHGDELVEVGLDILYDYSIAKFFPSLRSGVTKFFLGSVTDAQTRFIADKHIEESILELQNIESLECVGTEGLGSMADKIDKCHLAIAFTKGNFSLIDRLIDAAADCCDIEDSVYTHVRRVLLKFMNSPIDEIRQYTYEKCCKFTGKCLEIESNSLSPSSKLSTSLKFLLSEHFLTAIIRNGLQDANESVRKSSSWMLHQFLNSQLLFDSSLWNFFIDNVMQFFIILQCYTSKDSKFGSTLLELVSEDRNTRSTLLNIPSVDKLRGCLRLMFNCNLKVRIEGVGMLVWYLAKEPHGHSRLPSFSSSPLPKLHNLLYPENQVKIEQTSGNLNTQISTLNNVFDIARSEKLDEGVRKSGFDQLAILLQDRNLHEEFIRKDGVEFVLQIMETALERDQINNTIHAYLPSTIAIFRHLFFWQSNLRHKFSHNSKMFYSLVRSALVLVENKGAMIDISICLSLLLFDEILMSGTDEVFSLPKITLQNFKLPFVVEATDDKVVFEALPSFPNASEHPRSIGYLNQVMFHNKVGGDGNCSELEQARFDCSDIRLGIGGCLNKILSADSHSTVYQNIQLLQLYILVANESDSYKDYLRELDFDVALGRFICVPPSSVEDQNLLSEVFSFLDVVSRCKYLPHISAWLFELCGNKDNFLITVLSMSSESDASEKAVKSQRNLLRRLLHLLSNISQRMSPFQISMISHLISALLDRIKLSDSSECYDLASLQMAVFALSHITCYSGWADFVNESVLSRVFPALLSILKSFYSGRVQNNLSFMGCAVTRSIFVTLAHLAHEFHLTFKSDSIWIESWTVPLTVDEPFDWIVSQWVYRAPEVRALAINLASILSSSVRGQEYLVRGCQAFPGGIWSSLLNIALDGSESCAVKCQALAVLVNFMKSGDLPTIEECETEVYLGPSVMDDEGDCTVSGYRALELLLHHCKFFNVFSQSIVRYFPFTKLAFQFESEDSLDQTTTRLERFNMESARISLDRLEFHISPSQPVATPALISSFCCMTQSIATLLPDFVYTQVKKLNIFQELLRMLDVSIISQILSKFHSFADDIPRHRIGLLFNDLTTTTRSIVQLLSVLSQNNPCISSNESLFVGTIAQFLTVLPRNPQEKSLHQQLSSQLQSFLSNICKSLRVILQNGSRRNVDTVITVLLNNWHGFSNTVLFLTDRNNEIVSGDFLYLFSLLLSRSSTLKKGETLTSSLDAEENENKSLGHMVCDNILQLYQLHSGTVAIRPIEECLKTIVAFSATAKEFAVQNGMIEHLIDEVKQMHVRMNSLNLAPKSSAVNAAVRDENIPAKLVSVLGVLRNIMFGDETAKTAAMQCGLTGNVTKLWPWCTVESSLMFAVLECLSVYAACCHSAAVSLSMSLSANAINRHASSNTIVHQLIKATQKELNPATCSRTDLPLVKSIFTLLSTISLTTECRGIMWKANFLQKFSDVIIPKKSGPSEDTFSLWLSLFVNVSFSADGQQMIVRMNGSIDKLIEAVRVSTSSNVVSSALIILHNVSFHSSNKAKLLANAQLIPVIMKVATDENEPRHVLLAVAMFWTLLHNNQKAKVAFKNASLLPLAQNKLISVKSALSKDPKNSDLFNISCYLQTIITNISS